jgi:hypothetical protein
VRPAPELLRLATRCPDYGRYPALRVYPAEQQRWEWADPEAPVLSVQCKCATRYVLTAAAFRDAR